jgi:hypothetical protein
MSKRFFLLPGIFEESPKNIKTSNTFKVKKKKKELEIKESNNSVNIGK